MIPNGIAFALGERILGDLVGGRVDHADLTDAEFGEPEVAVGTEGNPEGLGIRSRNREFRDGVWLTESIVPILSAPNSVNQMLLPGPAVIPSGAAPCRWGREIRRPWRASNATRDGRGTAGSVACGSCSIVCYLPRKEPRNRSGRDGVVSSCCPRAETHGPSEAPKFFGVRPWAIVQQSRTVGAEATELVPEMLRHVVLRPPTQDRVRVCSCWKGSGWVDHTIVIGVCQRVGVIFLVG